MRFETVILDIDGTLIDDQQRLSSDTRKAILLLADRGIRIVFCSGRMYLSAKLWVDRNLGREFPMISYNGAQIHLPCESAPFYSRGLSFENALNILTVLKEKRVYRQFYWEKRIFASAPGVWAAYYSEHSGVEVEVLEDLEGFLIQGQLNPVKILAIDEPQKIDQLQVVMKELIQGVTIFKSFPTYLDFTPEGIHKGSAIIELSKRLNFSLEKTVMLGDSENDGFGFEVVGYSVAMGNADVNLKKKASWVSEDNNHEGALLGLYHCFPDGYPNGLARI